MPAETVNKTHDWERLAYRYDEIDSMGDHYLCYFSSALVQNNLEMILENLQNTSSIKVRVQLCSKHCEWGPKRPGHRKPVYELDAISLRRRKI